MIVWSIGRFSHDVAAKMKRNAIRPRTRSIDLVFQKNVKR
jgi:hypothetical protein